MNRNEYLIAELALTLLHVRLKREAVDVRAQKWKCWTRLSEWRSG